MLGRKHATAIRGQNSRDSSQHPPQSRRTRWRRGHQMVRKCRQDYWEVNWVPTTCLYATTGTADSESLRRIPGNSSKFAHTEPGALPTLLYKLQDKIDFSPTNDQKSCKCPNKKYVFMTQCKIVIAFVV